MMGVDNLLYVVRVRKAPSKAHLQRCWGEHRKTHPLDVGGEAKKAQR